MTVSYIIPSDDTGIFYRQHILTHLNLNNTSHYRILALRVIHTTQSFLQKPKTGTYPCLHCIQCSNILKGDTFYHPHSGKKYKIKDYSTCDTTFVIYLINCPCGLLYIGETTQPIKD
ncbi:unnamed protein product [Ranitomeya imitator]|uniref:GIY-YIG homing endonuclease n=1 Tax=Ranitomeya imitator TaxID=111125 RepID=A0ABN9LH54_9NEOB|nr:unnamed protein product [Ranitomeya imitator]